MRNKPIFLALLVWVILLYMGFSAYGDEKKQPLALTLETKEWGGLAQLFGDESYKPLLDYFAPALKIITEIPQQGNSLNYSVKFPQYAETGMILFDLENGKYFRLEIKNQITPMQYIDKFRRFPAAGTVIRAGDALLAFKDGYFYEAVPMRSLVLFKGNWNFYINPNDPEERKTLQRLYKRDYFQRDEQSCILILQERQFMEALTPDSEINASDPVIQELSGFIQSNYGVENRDFREYWHLPFPQGANVVIFRKDKNSFYQYYHNAGSMPDTALTESDTQNLILNYNAVKGIKLSFGEPQKVEAVELNIYFDPVAHFLSGSASLTWKNEASVRQVMLANGLNMMRNMNPELRGVTVFRRNETCYIMGAPEKNISWYYQGNFSPPNNYIELFASPEQQGAGAEDALMDTAYYLSPLYHYYPNPGDELFKTRITVKTPGELNLLASGSLLEKKQMEDKSSTVYLFESQISRGVALVAGKFELNREITATETIPLRFFTYESLDAKRRLDLTEISDAFGFFWKKYGPLDVKAINILLRRGMSQGGISNPGFIVFVLPPDRAVMHQISSRNSVVNRYSSLKSLSPVQIRNKTEDFLFHELAHQWWGEILPCKSHQDNWISEGMAHFSVLHYLKNRLPAGEFSRAAKRLKHWVYHYAENGPVVYGNRIYFLGDGRAAFQSIIYNKPALMMIMLMDILGEEEFEKRLSKVLHDFRYTAVSTNQFIGAFSDGDARCRDFFKKWLYSRELPEVELSLAEDTPEYDKTTYKTIFLRVKQLTDPFIFPLKLRVVSQAGTDFETVIMEEKEQVFRIRRETSIRSVNVEDNHYLVRERTRPAPPQKKSRNAPR